MRVILQRIGTMIRSHQPIETRCDEPPAALVADDVIDVDDCPIMPSRRSGPAWPDDPDEVPEWILAAERKRAAAGIVPVHVPTRTRRQYEDAIERVRSRLEHEATRIKHPALAPADAAAEFVAMLRSTERTGQYTSDELSAAYLDHCTATSRKPCGERLLRAELAKVPGVVSKQSYQKVRGSRYRPTLWYIAPAAVPAGIETHVELSYEHEDRRIAA